MRLPSTWSHGGSRNPHSPLTLLLLIFFNFLCGVNAGVADDSGRSRNILPLPEITDDAGGDQGSDFWKPFANQGIKALNELSGCLIMLNVIQTKNQLVRNAGFYNQSDMPTCLHILIHHALRTAMGYMDFFHPLAFTTLARVRLCPMPKETFPGHRLQVHLSLLWIAFLMATVNNWGLGTSIC